MAWVAVALAALIATSAQAGKWECGERSNLPMEGRTYCAGGDFRQTELELGKVLKDKDKLPQTVEMKKDKRLVSVSFRQGRRSGSSSFWAAKLAR